MSSNVTIVSQSGSAVSARTMQQFLSLRPLCTKTELQQQESAAHDTQEPHMFTFEAMQAHALAREHWVLLCS